jgi:hypothetical protein
LKRRGRIKNRRGVEDTKTEEAIGITLVSYRSFAVKRVIKKERERFSSLFYTVLY